MVSTTSLHLWRPVLALSFLMAVISSSGSIQCAKHPGELCDEDGEFSSCPNQELVIYSPPQFLEPLRQREKRVEFADQEWVIEQDWDSVGVAAVVWEPALALCQYLEESGAELLRGKRVIELGAGTGLVGLVAHALGAADVLITDRNPQPAQHNLQLNSPNLDTHRPVSVHELTWGQPLSHLKPPYDIVLAADVVYIEESFPALIQTMDQLSGSGTLLLLSCKYRYERDSRFLQLLGERFQSEVVWTGGDLSIYILKKSPMQVM